MQSGAVVKNIDIIVYPFFGLGFELKTQAGRNKCGQWIKILREGVKSRDTAFIVLHMAEHELHEYEKEALPFIHKFRGALGELKKVGLAYTDWAGAPLKQTLEIERWLSEKNLAKNMRIRFYGQHAGACVTTVGQPIAQLLSIRLRAKRGVEAVYREASALSVKSFEAYAYKMLHSEVSRADTMRFLEAVARKERGASIFALRSPQKVLSFLNKKRR